VNERLLVGWQRETGSSDAARARLAEALTDWDEAPEPAPFAILDCILSLPPDNREQLLLRFEHYALEGIDFDGWCSFRAAVLGPETERTAALSRLPQT